MPKREELVLLRTSERGVWGQCHQQWAWRFIDNLQPRTSSPPLEFGTLWHKAMADYYIPGKKRGPHPAKSFKLYFDSDVASKFRLRNSDAEWDDALELGVAMAENYVDEFGRDSKIEIIAPEMPFAYRMTDVGGQPFWVVGRFDALFRWLTTHEYGILEHKTAASISTAHLQMDEQAGTYFMFGRLWVKELQRRLIIPKGNRLELDMVLYNFARKAKPDPRPRDDAGIYLNKDGTQSKTQPPPYFARVPVYRDEEDSKRLVKRIRQQAWMMRQQREGKLPIIKTPSSGYPDRHCEACPFKAMCELHETGGDWRSYAKMNYDVADNYQEYKEDLEEDIITIGGRWN